MNPAEMQIWSLAALPLLVFFARVLDVSLGTVRIVLLYRGARRLAPLIGFLEMLVWLVAVGQVVQHLDRPLHYLAFAAGFATGTWVGLRIDERLALGLVAVEIISPSDASDLVAELRDEGFGVTTVAARGLKGRVRLIITVIRRRDYRRLARLVERIHGDAFVTVSDVRAASRGYFQPAVASFRPWLELTGKK